MAVYRTGLLIIRAWVEKGSPKILRANVRTTTDVSKGFDSELTVADIPAASSIVQTWLEQVLDEEEPKQDERKPKEPQS